MVTSKKLKKRLWILLMLSIVLFVSAFLISYSVKRYYTPQKVSERITSEIAVASEELENEIAAVADRRKEDSTTFFKYLQTEYGNSFRARGIEILLYENDSLKYWTANVFAAPRIKDSENFMADVIRSGSGYYLLKHRKIKNATIVALQLIRYNYKYSNEYLPSGFYKRFSAPDNASVDLRPGKYNIKDPGGKFLFQLAYEQPFKLALWLQYILFTIYISSFLCLISAVFTAYLFLMSKFGHRKLLFLAFICDVIILRFAQFYFHFPPGLYESDLFSPAYFASSDLLPSLGDFLINVIIGVQVVFIAFKYIAFWFKTKRNVSVINKLSLLIFLASTTLFYFLLNESITGLVLNSNISFRFGNLLDLPHFSHTGIFIIAFLLLSFLFFFEFTSRLCSTLQISSQLFIIYAVSAFLLFSGLTFIAGKFDVIHILFLVSLYGLLFISQKQSGTTKIRIGRMVSLLILLSAIATYQLNKSETIRDQEKSRLLATNLADARDNLAEYYYNEAAKSIRKDTLLIDMLNVTNSSGSLDKISDYIRNKYFTGYWSKYLVQITICQPDKKLNIKPGNIITGCDEYFNGKIEQFMRQVSIPGLYFLRHSVDAMYYLGKIPVNAEQVGNAKGSTLFIEISSNDIWKGLGYPELLNDTKNNSGDNLYGYSYAFYSKGELVKNVGKYSYDTDNQSIKSMIGHNGFVKSKGYNHFIYQADAETMIILSTEAPRASELISPFSYLFVLLLFMLLVIDRLKGSWLKMDIGIYTFRLRLQVVMISVIVVSSVVLVTVSLLFINKINSNKNNEILNEKLNSVLVDLENRYGNFTSFDVIAREELSDLLMSLSNTYFTDINIYNSRGYLLASSRDQIFREEMISEQISPLVAQKLLYEKQTFLLQRENIGSYKFLSAYTPVRNIDNQLLGYLNLPYFARQEEIRREISGLISTFANIYIIMIVITVLLALVLSRYITRPLQQIGNQFSIIKIGNKNAKIEWTRKDEIGRLVEEYNRMIDEMEKSAELLARSERESAWRMMARQVAHEIKNPLTPIKLSMQLLMRAWNDKAPDWDARLKRFSQTLIMQIDTLSSIATEFSDFAQMPEPQIQPFDVIPLVQQSVTLFRDQSDCEILFESELDECIILADPNQILRVFNNLIKNALQAVTGERQGMIKIKLAEVDNFCELIFQDNGTGIPDEMQTRIFSPNFTTKTAGMGLGLAMVKNIIDSSSGRIRFESKPGEGTTFIVWLPLQA